MSTRLPCRQDPTVTHTSPVTSTGDYLVLPTDLSACYPSVVTDAMSETRRGPPYTGSPLAFLLGMLLFLGSILLFVGDLLLDNDVLRSIVINALGAAIMILWAAQDTLFDPDSDVGSIGGATGTALLLYGVYLLFAGVAIAGTGVFFHERATLGMLYIILAVVATGIGLVIFPTSAIVADDGTTPDADNSADDERDNPTTDEG